jgi:hypothetical protein
MHQNDERRERPGFAAVLGLTAAMALGTTALATAAEVKAPTRLPARTPVNQVHIGEAGLRVYIDPATGQIKQPTEADRQALEKAMAPLFANRLKKNVTVTQFADGTVKMSLAGQFLSVALVTTNANGTLSQSCVSSMEEATAVINAAPALEEK